MLDLRANAGLEFLDLIYQAVALLLLVQRATLAWSHAGFAVQDLQRRVGVTQAVQRACTPFLRAVSRINWIKKQRPKPPSALLTFDQQCPILGAGTGINEGVIIYLVKVGMPPRSSALRPFMAAATDPKRPAVSLGTINDPGDLPKLSAIEI